MSGTDGFDKLLGPPASPAKRRRQQASHARFDHAAGLVEQAAKAASAGDQPALDALVARMDQLAFDDFEERHPPSAALDYLLYEVVCDLVPDDADARFGDTWVDHVVFHADQDLPGGVARWVRVAVGMAAEEYQLSNPELEAIARVRGDLRPERDSDLVTWLAAVDQRPRGELLHDGVQALVWLRAFTG
jgi:hypothetical protein